MDYINEEKTIITLPVPLGSTLYTPVTSCGDFCYFQKELFDSTFPPVKGSRCSHQMPCHTKSCTVRRFIFSFQNMETVLRDYGTWIFASKEEAAEKGERYITENRDKMRELGFFVAEDGYGKPKEEIAN